MCVCYTACCLAVATAPPELRGRGLADAINSELDGGVVVLRQYSIALCLDNADELLEGKVMRCQHQETLYHVKSAWCGGLP